jgi:hypothetical protein
LPRQHHRRQLTACAPFYLFVGNIVFNQHTQAFEIYMKSAARHIANEFWWPPGQSGVGLNDQQENSPASLASKQLVFMHMLLAVLSPREITWRLRFSCFRGYRISQRTNSVCYYAWHTEIEIKVVRRTHKQCLCINLVVRNTRSIITTAAFQIDAG